MFTCKVYLLHIASVSPKNKTASAALSLYSSTQLNSSSEIQCLQHESTQLLSEQSTNSPNYKGSPEQEAVHTLQKAHDSLL